MNATTLISSHDFAQALASANETGRFVSVPVKNNLLKYTTAAFLLPLLAVVALASVSSVSSTLLSDASQTLIPTYSAAVNVLFNDEISVANHFLSQATSLPLAANNESQVNNLLSVAKSQIQAVLDRDPHNVQALAMAQETTSILASTQPTRQQIAAPAVSVSDASNIKTSASLNSNEGSVVFKENTTSLWVSDPQLRDGTQLYIVRQTQGENDVIYVKDRIAGKGFSLESSAPLSKDVSLTWYEISPDNGTKE